MRMLRLGPLVSFKGSPTVSPITAAYKLINLYFKLFKLFQLLQLFKCILIYILNIQKYDN
jgi:hypothetical protein